MRLLLRVLTLFVCTSFSTGCVLDRLYTTHDQLCAERSEIVFERDARRGTKVRFTRPTLRASDVTWLVGAAPSRVDATGDVQHATYRVRPVGPDGAKHAFDVALRFEGAGGGALLAEVRLPAEVEPYLTDAMIEDGRQTSCEVEPDLWARTAAVEIDSFRPEMLPARAELLRLFGPPNRPTTDPRELAWAFCLDPCTPADVDDHARLGLRFDAQGLVSRMALSYGRYEMEADFDAGRAHAAMR